LSFPIINDYRNAIRNASSRLATLDVTPQVDANGNPFFLAGNFAGVFKVVAADGNQLAIKCFIRVLPELGRRYRAIASYFQKTRASYMLDFDFLPNEIFATSSIAPSKEYPVVTMPWIEGRAIGAVIETFCTRDNREGLATLNRAWVRMCLDLLDRGIAHGDLKHDNVLITPKGQLKLIDYESMYLPALKGLDAILLGGVHYQHPARTVDHFDPALDHFSMLVIALSLRVLTLDPGLYTTYHFDENIILGRKDFASPKRSRLFKQLMQSPDSLVRDWTRQLIRACGGSSVEIPGLKRILRPAMKVNTEIKKAGMWKLFA